jgi:hypothetical protein
MGDSLRRRHQRYAFRYRISVKLRGTGHDVQLDGITKNVSAGGVLLESSTRLPKRSLVSFTIVAHRETMIHPIEFTGEGKVVRVEPDPGIAGYAIALKCLQPIQFHPFARKDNLAGWDVSVNS